MNLRELAEKWEKSADSETAHPMEADVWAHCAAELRAALEEQEQPLAKRWREQGEKFHQQGMDTSDDKMQFAFWSMADLCEEHAGDLESRRDRDRELLREAVRLLDIPKPNQKMEQSRIDMASRIRHHLEKREAKELRKESAKDKDINTVLDKKLVADINDLRAAELRAALPEQPVAFQFGNNFQYIANFWPPENVGDTPIRPLYADLDSHESELREFMQQLEERMRARYVGATEEIHSVLVEFADEIRKHLGGDSDEA